jgi:hypothetical protein
MQLWSQHQALAVPCTWDSWSIAAGGATLKTWRTKDFTPWALCSRNTAATSAHHCQAWGHTSHDPHPCTTTIIPGGSHCQQHLTLQGLRTCPHSPHPQHCPYHHQRSSVMSIQHSPSCILKSLAISMHCKTALPHRHLQSKPLRCSDTSKGLQLKSWHRNNLLPTQNQSQRAPSK